MARSSAATLSGWVRSALGALRARFAARPDTEHEQAIVRLVVGALIVLYVLPGAVARALSPTIFVMLAYLGVALVIFLHILRSPGQSTPRRVVGVLADLTTLTWVMASVGERAAPLFLVYVWVTLANGFRFGQRFLLLSLGLSAAGFGAVLWYSDYWHRQETVGYGLLLGFVVLSLYVRSLVTKLFDAVARAEAANQAKRRFISVVSHEMRTPLNAIIGMADLLRETTMTREQADMLQTMRSSSRVMLALVEDVLDFSKIEAGKLVLEKTDFDLHALVNSTCRILATQAASKGLEFVVSIMPEVPPALRGDPYYLRQILINLAGNAIKFTERGSVTVHVSAQLETAAAVRLKFSIRDTGIGIAPEAQSRIFESFTQADQSTTRRFGGTGLGTTIAKQLVSLMGGRIGVESAVGLGTTFWFELDVDKQPERLGIGTGELAGARILLVGFRPADSEALESAFAGWGSAPIAVANVEEGAARLVAEISLARPYHSVLIYSGNEGTSLARRFRRSAPQPVPPLVLVTPEGTAVERFEALAGGFGAVLQLPIDKRLLFNVLHSVSAGEEVAEGVVRLQDYARRTASGRKLRVLVADDNPTNREVIGKILERGGHAVTLVNDGEQALEMLERERPDIVLLDRNMPRMGGIETLQAIRVLTGGMSHLPVIMFSADVTSEAKREALEAGCDAFLGKPIEALKLLEEIHALTSSQAEPHRRRTPIAVVPTTPELEASRAVPVNAETLARLQELGSNPAFVERLVSVFLADNAALMSRIEQALAGRNYPEIRPLLHAMKGSSASMGTDRLTALCGKIGALSDSELRLQSAGLARMLTEELALARSELDSYLREHRQSAG
ncbi:MAG TPA: response regulator [Burkholderiales bacterium]|jgi:two-component system sensor histidine kinase RpfC|nr:response regulator [Burkholderiales bacterium]